MSITINELSITVPGNVVKNNDANGNSVLRVTQGQAQNLYDQLGPVLDFFNAQHNGQVSVVAPEQGSQQGPKAKANTEAGIQHDGDKA